MTEYTATGDSSNALLYYYDAKGHPRVATFYWRNYTGALAKGVAILDETGQLTLCGVRPDGGNPYYCSADDSVPTQVIFQSQFAEAFRVLDPLVKFEACDTAYHSQP
jgi:hypothetical protein